MTREEAIQVLESMKSKESYNALIDLCNMAIEALSEVRCNDCKWNDDVIEVVRCKDCLHYKSDGGAMMVCDVSDIVVNDDDFCSYGERKDK